MKRIIEKANNWNCKIWLKVNSFEKIVWRNLLVHSDKYAKKKTIERKKLVCFENKIAMLA